MKRDNRISREPIPRLSPRLQAIADMVRLRGTVCDVGCDHAHIPISLILSGRIRAAIGMDVIEGPLEKAGENLERYGCAGGVQLRLSDGLDEYSAGEAQSLIISGMGGRIMRKILLREPEKTRSFGELILQPQADPEQVRAALCELGFMIDAEKMIAERGKFYTVIHAVPAGSEREDSEAEDDGICLSPEELFYGPILLREGDPVLCSFLMKRREAQKRVLASIKNSMDHIADQISDRPSDDDQKRRSELAARYREAEEVKDRIERAILMLSERGDLL